MLAMIEGGQLQVILKLVHLYHGVTSNVLDTIASRLDCYARSTFPPIKMVGKYELSHSPIAFMGANVNDI